MVNGVQNREEEQRHSTSIAQQQNASAVTTATTEMRSAKVRRLRSYDGVVGRKAGHHCKCPCAALDNECLVVPAGLAGSGKMRRFAEIGLPAIPPGSQII
eukprot:4244561-Amphidinium_carterae.1